MQLLRHAFLLFQGAILSSFKIVTDTLGNIQAIFMRIVPYKFHMLNEWLNWRKYIRYELSPFMR